MSYELARDLSLSIRIRFIYIYIYIYIYIWADIILSSDPTSSSNIVMRSLKVRSSTTQLISFVIVGSLLSF